MNIDIIEWLRASGWHNYFLYYMGLLASPYPVSANDKMKENAEEKM